MRVGHLVSDLGQVPWSRPGVPLALFRAVFVAKDWGAIVVVRVRGERRAVAVDVYALAALDAAMGAA